MNSSYTSGHDFYLASVKKRINITSNTPESDPSRIIRDLTGLNMVDYF